MFEIKQRKEKKLVQTDNLVLTFHNHLQNS